MKIEISAGGVVVRSRKGGWEVLLVRDMNHELTFPKGLVEKGEDLVAAAVREMHEEVGITDVTLVGPIDNIRYMYRRNGLISKVVHYFLFKSKGEEKLMGQKEEGLHDVQWMPLSEAITAIGYSKTNKPLLEKTKQLL